MKLRWGIDQVYFYLVCFVMIITIIVGVTGLVRAGIDLIFPYPEGEWKSPWPRDPVEYRDPAGEYQSTLPADVIEREVELQEQIIQERNRTNSRNESILSIFSGLALLLVAFPVYLYHWRKISLLN